MGPTGRSKSAVEMAKTWLPEPERGVQQKYKGKKGVIPAASVHLREVGTIYVAIFSNDKEMTAFWTFHRKISTKNAANGNKHA